LELQRLVIDDGEQSVSADFHPGLTVVALGEPGYRTRFVSGLLESLGGDRDGVHLELTDRNGHYLVVFRPAASPHRVIDADAGGEVTASFTRAGGSVDLLGGSGIDRTAGLRLMHLGPYEVEHADDSGTDDHRLAHHLATLDQAQLWELADQLAAAERRLAEATAALIDQPAVGGRSNSDAGEAAHGPQGGHGANGALVVQHARAIELADEARSQVELAAKAHRSVMRLGLLVAGACTGVGLLLLALNGVLQDNNWTAKALLLLAVVSLVVALADRRHLSATKRQERRMRAALPESSRLALELRSGPLADDMARTAVLETAAQHDLLTTRWRLLSGGVAVKWALANRAAIETLAHRRQTTSEHLGAEFKSERGAPADTARLVVHRLLELRAVGPQHERLPLVLEEPFLHLEATERVRLLETVLRMAADQQVVLVTSDARAIAWAEPRSVAGQLGLVYVGHATSAQPQPAAG
jgi:hypothetical protein